MAPYEPPLGPAEATVERRRGLSRRERRQRGLTFRNIRRITKDLKAAGDLEDLTGAEVSLAVMAQLQKDAPEGWEDVDWDEVFDFIFRIVEMFMTLFGGL